MKKRIEWLVKDSGGKLVTPCSTRVEARQDIKWYNDNMFNEWMGDINFPLHIERQEWVLKDAKVVV